MVILFIQMRKVLGVSMIFLLLLPMTALAKTYRWADEHGNVSYSQNIPPSAAQNGHTEMNEKSGRVLNNISSRQDRERERQQASLLKAKEKKRQLQLREELSLQLFSSRTEVIKHFERRLEMVSVNLRLLQYHKRRLLKEITKIQKNARSLKTRKEKRNMSRRLQKMQSTLLEHTRAIENNQQEQVVTSSNKKRALSRYDKNIENENKTVSRELGVLREDNKSACACTCDKDKKRVKDKP